MSLPSAMSDGGDDPGGAEIASAILGGVPDKGGGELPGHGTTCVSEETCKARGPAWVTRMDAAALNRRANPSGRKAPSCEPVSARKRSDHAIVIMFRASD